MGILAVNIVSFAMPGDAYINPVAWGQPGRADLTAWAIVQLLFEGRMRGLFALLFGAGVLMIAERSAQPFRRHYARMGVLALFGLTHGYLVWNGDILVHYAILGCLLPLVWDAGAGRLARAGIAVLAIQTLLMSAEFAGAFAFRAAAEAPGAPATLVAGYRALIASFPHPGSAAVAADLAAYRGGWFDAVHYRWAVRGDTPVRLLQYAGGESFGYMLLGMALYRAGALTGGWSRPALRRMIACGYGIGLPVISALTAWAVASRFDPIVLMGNFLAWSIPFRVASVLGHLALILLVADRFGDRRFVTRVAAAGRMAFTNYLATSVVMIALFYGHGAGLYGTVPRAPLYAIVAAMWAAMLLWSPWWLARFHYGPMEWLWRRLAGSIAKDANATQ
jgi:uncharacterized protein